MESSAYMSILASDISKIASFMNIIKSKGPSIEPCGTLVVTGRGSDNTRSYFTHW